MRIQKQIMRSSLVLLLLALVTFQIMGGLVLRNFPKDNGRLLSPEEIMHISSQYHMPLAQLDAELKSHGYRIIVAEDSFVSESERFSQLLSNFMASGIVAGVIILLFSFVFTRALVRRIMRPLDELTEAARRIENGNLSVPIIYMGEYEFASVCAAFNRMQSHLLEEQRKNAAYEKARIGLVAGISHDLRTPLTSVKGYIKGLQDGIADTEEKRARYLDTAYRKSGEMEQLLQRLLEFSRMETGQLPLYRRAADLCAFIGDCAGELRREPLLSGVEIEADLCAEPCCVDLDREQMRRVVANLTDNSLKYAGAEKLKLRLSVRREGASAVFEFADNGRGVPEHHLHSIFEEFWRSDESRSRKNGEGSGLGLYIVKDIVEAHGGTVSAHNSGGLVITLRLPLHEGEI